MASLTLVGTIHWDPNGLPRLMETLERESPHIITLEMSEYGVAFRERAGPSLKEKVFDILQGLYEKNTQKESGNSTGLKASSKSGPFGQSFLPWSFRSSSGR